jgi:hypothetical protein
MARPMKHCAVSFQGFGAFLVFPSTSYNGHDSFRKRTEIDHRIGLDYQGAASYQKRVGAIVGQCTLTISCSGGAEATAR